MVSGGLDSTVLAAWLRDAGARILPLFVNYGQHSAETEWAAVTTLVATVDEPAVRIDSTVFAGSASRLIREADLWRDDVVDADLILPYRNLFLLATGAAVASANDCSTVAAAFINSNRLVEVDATRRYLDTTNRAFGSLGSVRLLTPFSGLSKADVARLGVLLGVPVALTYSCLVRSATHCGACGNCIDRLAAFKAVSG
jgi:7-cyano-7-deazaguanine synthase